MTGRVQAQPLSLLTGGVIVAGLIAVAVQLLTLDADLAGVAPWVVPMNIILVAVASSAVVRVRVRSANVGTAWTDSAIIICIVTLPSAWVAVDVFTGVLIAKLFCRISPYKALYNAGNLHLREALKNGEGEAIRSLPLIELAKQHYRDLLRADPGRWDARYNLERALWLAPEADDAASADDARTTPRERAITTMRSDGGDLP